VLAVGGVGLTVWAGALLAARLLGQGRFAAGIADEVEAAFRLPSHASDPAAAWPPETAAALPAPVAYRSATAVTLAVVAALAASGFVLWRRVPRVGRRIAGGWGWMPGRGSPGIVHRRVKVERGSAHESSHPTAECFYGRETWSRGSELRKSMASKAWPAVRAPVRSTSPPSTRSVASTTSGALKA
jgi:hypothetical protein